MPVVFVDARPSARHHRFPARAGNENGDYELEEICRRQTWRGMAARFFDHRLRDQNELQEKTSYILMNPVRKGLCERAEDWIWIYRPTDRPPPKLD